MAALLSEARKENQALREKVMSLHRRASEAENQKYEQDRHNKRLQDKLLSNVRKNTPKEERHLDETLQMSTIEEIRTWTCKNTLNCNVEEVISVIQLKDGKLA